MAAVPNNLITLYGRNPVLEALSDPAITPWRLHLSERNRPADVLDSIETLAHQRGIEVHRHTPERLSRISRNGKQDQGVALDIIAPGHQSAQALLDTQGTCRLLALDRIHNPQNLGMIIRSVTAGFIDGILLPKKGSSGLNALAIKASAGTALRCNIYHCKELIDVLPDLIDAGFFIYTLQADAPQSAFEADIPKRCILVLGNESEGVSDSIQAMAHGGLAIPMRGNIESLNVAATATLLSFLPGLRA
ncbi:MAG TPA: RNA methyltransferase [Pseudomonadales bacterium]|jgi:23S rRNA (guanosine2251-2'-O)-methyltransferase